MASVEQEIVAFFEGKGLTRAQAAGIAGNAKQESSYNPSEAGGGLFQDIGSRAPSGTGGVQHQLEAAWGELRGTPTLTTLKATRTPEEAARVFSTYFERPGTPMLSNREKYAREAYNNSTTPGEKTSILESFEKFGLDPGYALDAAGKFVKGESGEPEGIPEMVGSGPFNAIESTGSFIKALTEPSTWLRLAEGIGGIILFMVGLKTLTRGSISLPSAPKLGVAAAVGGEVGAKRAASHQRRRESITTEAHTARTQNRIRLAQKTEAAKRATVRASK